MKFEIHAEKSSTDKAVFYYDNVTNVLTNESGKEFKDSNFKLDPTTIRETKPFSKDNPLKKSKLIECVAIK